MKTINVNNHTIKTTLNNMKSYIFVNILKLILQHIDENNKNMTLLYRDKTTEKVIETLKLNDYIETVEIIFEKDNKKFVNIIFNDKNIIRMKKINSLYV